MSFLSLRRLDADPNPLLAAYTTATGQVAEAATTAPATQPAGHAYLFQVLGVLEDHRGVLTDSTPGLPRSTDQPGEN